MRPTGWIPPKERTFGDPFTPEIPNWRDVRTQIGTPDEANTAVLEYELLDGKIVPRVWQVTGSCVGAGGANAYVQAMVGDVYHRGDFEEIKLTFPFAPYGVGRQIAGMGGTGSGSFGGAQAKAVSHEVFGMLPFDYPNLPQPTIRGNWAQWTEREELAWSHPRAWPIPRTELEPTSKTFGFHDIARARSTKDVREAIAQGYGVTMASMYGSTAMSIEDGVLVARWNTSWAHQMSSFAYRPHQRHGTVYAIQNQWGSSIHPKCPLLEPLGVTGAFWIPEDDLERNIKRDDTEVFVHSATGGFPKKEIDWAKINYNFNHPPYRD